MICLDFPYRIFALGAFCFTKCKDKCPSVTTIHILSLTSIEPVLNMRDGEQYMLYIQLLNKA